MKMQVNILDDGSHIKLSTAAHTVGLALAGAGMFTYLGDEVDPPLDSLLYPGLDIVIRRSWPIEIDVDGELLTTRTRRARVLDVLADVGVSLAGSDYTVPALHEVLPEDPIRVVRVVEQTITEYTPIPFSSLLRGLSDMEIDNSSVIQAGLNGLQAQQVRIIYENEVEISRSLEDKWVYLSPTPRVTGYGSRIKIRTVDTPLGSIQYWRRVPMYATSYSPSRSGTPVTASWYGMTRSGKVLKKGMVAVDPGFIPLGTLLYVPGYGLATAEDTGSGVRGRMIDLGFEDDNYQPWHREVTVYFRTPIPPVNEITWIIP